MSPPNDGSSPSESPSDWLKAVEHLGAPKVFPPRTIIIHEGDPGDTLFVIKSGRGKVFATNATGKEVIFADYGPGDTLGEPSLDGGLRSASVMTVEQTTCLIVPVSVAKRLIGDNPALAWQIIRNLIRLMRAANDNVKSLALEDVYGRVVRFLMKACEPWDGGVGIIRERLTHQSIADRIGASREMVSRIFKDLEKGGYLSVKDGCIQLHKKLPPAW